MNEILEFQEEMNLFQYISSIPMSNSRIETYRKCPRSYYRSYVLHEKTSATIPMRMGTIIHSALETFVGTQSKSVDDLMVIVEGAIFQNESYEGILEYCSRLF
jgi:ATP-dependent helicase/DNAse subunit B